MTVADAAQRSGMSETDLRAMNNIPPRMLIKAGSTLIVPRSARVQEDVAAAVADTGHLASLDIVEINPAYDTHNRTAELAVDLVESLFGKSTLMRQRR